MMYCVICPSCKLFLEGFTYWRIVVHLGRNSSLSRVLWKGKCTSYSHWKSILAHRAQPCTIPLHMGEFYLCWIVSLMFFKSEKVQGIYKDIALCSGFLQSKSVNLSSQTLPVMKENDFVPSGHSVELTFLCQWSSILNFTAGELPS